MLLKDRIILITGTSRGIGMSIAKRCLDEGASIVACFRTYTENLISFERKYEHERFLPICVDVTSEKSVANMMETIRLQFGRLDGIVNNAGIITRTFDWKNISNDDWLCNYSTNVLGPWNIIRYGNNLMFNGGSIVNISSIYSEAPEIEALSYSISKAGLEAMSIALAKKLAPKIRVNALAPGNTRTDMVPDNQKCDIIEQRTLLKRSAYPDELAAVAVFSFGYEFIYNREGNSC